MSDSGWGDSDYDEIDNLIDNDPIALGKRCRAAEAEVERLLKSPWNCMVMEDMKAGQAAQMYRHDIDIDGRTGIYGVRLQAVQPGEVADG